VRSFPAMFYVNTGRAADLPKHFGLSVSHTFRAFASVGIPSPLSGIEPIEYLAEWGSNLDLAVIFLDFFVPVLTDLILVGFANRIMHSFTHLSSDRSIEHGCSGIGTIWW
jgi:hypothetical protein